MPFHLNVSNDGIVFQNYIQKACMPSKHVDDILYEIKELFIIPDLNCQLYSNAINLFLKSRTQYDLLAREPSAKYAVNDYIDLINRIKIIDEVPKGNKIERIAQVHQYLTSQISGEVIKKDQLWLRLVFIRIKKNLNNSLHQMII